MAVCFSIAIFFISGSIVGSLVMGGVFLLYLLGNIYFDYIDTKREGRARFTKWQRDSKSEASKPQGTEDLPVKTNKEEKT